MPTDEFNSHDVRFQAERMFIQTATMGAFKALQGNARPIGFLVYPTQHPNSAPLPLGKLTEISK